MDRVPLVERAGRGDHDAFTVLASSPAPRLDAAARTADLYFVTVGGQVLQQLGLRPLNLNGPEYELTGMTFSPDLQTIGYNASRPTSSCCPSPATCPAGSASRSRPA